MAKARRKKHNGPQLNNNGINAKPGTNNRLSIPRSMVIRMGAGEVGPSVSQLAMDFREVVQPHTAARLKERKANKLRDYTTMAGPLGVTHFFLFSRSAAGNVHMRFALHPRGPTLQFRVDDYVLCKDIQKNQRHSRMGWKEAFESPPLLVQHGMIQTSEQKDADPKFKQLESLAQTMFNSMFPVITPSTTKLEKIKRILLLKREQQTDGTFVVNLRHYAITTRKTGVSKSIRRFDTKEQKRREKRGSALPNLGKLEDMADYILNPADAGYTSASDTEVDTDNEVEVVQTSTKRVLSRKEMEKLRQSEQREMPQTKAEVEKRAIKLVELGPRMKLRLVKVEEGLSEGRVMWNEFVQKTEAEEQELDAKWDEKRKIKEARRQEQRENVERKKQLKEKTKKNTNQNGGEAEESDEENYDTDEIEDILDREKDGDLMDNDEDEDDEEGGVDVDDDMVE